MNKPVPAFSLPGTKITPCCPKCDAPMIHQPSAVQWHCARCNIQVPAK